MKKKVVKINPFVAQYSKVNTNKTPFNPIIHPVIFAQMCAWFIEDSPNETAGFFNWDETTNMIDWTWRDEEAIKTAGNVRYGTAKMRMAWPEEGIPRGQWHTHPGMGTFWSGTDKEDQLVILEELMGFEKNGHFVFIVLDELEWQVTKFTWADGALLYKQNGTVLVNGVAMDGLSLQVITGAAIGGAHDPYFNGYDHYSKSTSPPKIQEPAGYWDNGKWVTYTPKPYHGYDDDYVDDDVSEKELVDSMFRGGESADKFYDRLFHIFGVLEYRWEDLYDTIEAFYPNQYMEIVNCQVDWEWINRDMNKKCGLPEEEGMLTETEKETLGLSKIKIQERKGL